MGFSVGGEYTGVVAYLLEGAPPQRRGLVASLASAASEIGALLAVGVSALTVASMSEADLAGWGWRIPFVVGAALAASVWIARSAMEESPEFHRQQAAGTVPDNPLAPQPRQPPRRRSPARSRSRRWARSLIMSGSPTSRRS